MTTTALTRKQVAEAIEQRIADLGLEDTETNCYGLVCYDDTEEDGDAYRIDGDNSGEVMIDGPATLTALEDVDYTGDFDVDQAAFYDALVRVGEQ